MIALFSLVLVWAYAAVASSSARHGHARLWGTAVAATLLVALGSMLLGRYYQVPSQGRLVLYAMVLTGPIVLVPTTMLSFGAAGRRSRGTLLPMAILGAIIGLVAGLLLVVFWLRVW